MLVDGISHGDELGAVEVVGEFPAARCRPRRGSGLLWLEGPSVSWCPTTSRTADTTGKKAGVGREQNPRLARLVRTLLTHLPSIAQRHHMIDIDIRSLVLRLALKGAVPRPADGGAVGRVLDHVLAVTLQHHFARVAGPVLSIPGGEEIAVVAFPAAAGLDSERAELAQRGRVGGDVGRDWSRCRGRGGERIGVCGEDGEGEGKEDEWGLHLSLSELLMVRGEVFGAGNGERVDCGFKTWDTVPREMSFMVAQGITANLLYSFAVELQHGEAQGGCGLIGCRRKEACLLPSGRYRQMS